MAALPTLVLRDIHQPPAPPWWPPAPGWWLVVAVVLAALVAWAALRSHRRRRRAAAAAVFDAEVAAAATPTEQVAAMSALLRRAARQCDAAADRLQGEAWLAWLDGDDGARSFTTGTGRMLLDGGFRPDVASAEVAALRPLARARFLQLLEAGPRTRRVPWPRGHGREAERPPSRALPTALPATALTSGHREPGMRGHDGPGMATREAGARADRVEPRPRQPYEGSSDGASAHGEER